MALLSSSVIAELDKRKQLRETKAALSSSPGLARRPLHQPSQSQHKTAAATAAELKQVTIIFVIPNMNVVIATDETVNEGIR